MLCHILKSFEFSADGIHSSPAVAGSTADIPEDLVSGLEYEGYVRPAGSTKMAPPLSNTASVAPPPGAPATAEPEIPEDWQSLHWMKQCALASVIAGEKVETKDAAETVIQKELAARAAS